MDEWNYHSQDRIQLENLCPPQLRRRCVERVERLSWPRFTWILTCTFPLLTSIVMSTGPQSRYLATSSFQWIPRTRLYPRISMAIQNSAAANMSAKRVGVSPLWPCYCLWRRRVEKEIGSGTQGRGRVSMQVSKYVLHF